MLMMKIGEKCINFHTFAIDKIRLSKTYPKSLNISRIFVKETVSSSLFYKKICKSESEGTRVKQLHF